MPLEVESSVGWSRVGSGAKLHDAFEGGRPRRLHGRGDATLRSRWGQSVVHVVPRRGDVYRPGWHKRIAPCSGFVRVGHAVPVGVAVEDVRAEDVFLEVWQPVPVLVPVREDALLALQEVGDAVAVSVGELVAADVHAASRRARVAEEVGCGCAGRGTRVDAGASPLQHPGASQHRVGGDVAAAVGRPVGRGAVE